MLTLASPVTLQTERAEWRQFQRDLQVAVSVADRLRAEAEQALGALREHHGTAEARLAQALRRQQEQDRELRDLETQHRDARHQLSTLLAEEQRRRRERERERTGKDARISACGLAKDGAVPEVNAVGNPSEEDPGIDGKEEGKRENCAPVPVGKKDLEEKAFDGLHTDVEAQEVEGHCEAQPNGADDGGTLGCVVSFGGEGDPESAKTQLSGKGVAEGYILSLAARKKEAEAGNGTPDHRRVVMLSERSW